MNPKSLNDLDPKLKETYERVMGTSLTPTNSASTPTQSAPRPMQTTITQEPVTKPAEPIQQPFVKTAPEMVASPQTTKPTAPFTGIVIPSTNTLQSAAVTKKKKSLRPILLIAGGIVFFIAYGVVWAKVFGLF
jgi:hypothetical protein